MKCPGSNGIYERSMGNLHERGKWQHLYFSDRFRSKIYFCTTKNWNYYLNNKLNLKENGQKTRDWKTQRHWFDVTDHEVPLVYIRSRVVCHWYYVMLALIFLLQSYMFIWLFLFPSLSSRVVHYSSSISSILLTWRHTTTSPMENLLKNIILKYCCRWCFLKNIRVILCCSK